jgi:hypothetical protein
MKTQTSSNRSATQQLHGEAKEPLFPFQAAHMNAAAFENLAVIK